MKSINDILWFFAFNGVFVAAILFKLGFEKIAIVPLAISISSFAIVAYLYLCKLYLLISIKQKGKNYSIKK